MCTNAVISKAILERDRIRQDRRKYTQKPYKKSAQKTLSLFTFFFTAKS